MNKVFSQGNIDASIAQTLNTIILFLLILQILPSAGFSVSFISNRIVASGAVTVFVGNFLFAALTKYLVKSEEFNSKTTAIPHGITTIIVLSFSYFILVPMYLKTKSFEKAYEVTLTCCFLLGFFELVCLKFVEIIRQIIPNAAMMAALSGIGLTFISMSFFVNIFQQPLTGIVPLFLILITYASRTTLPFKLPAALVSLLLGTLIYYTVGNLLPWAIEPIKIIQNESEKDIFEVDFSFKHSIIFKNIFNPEIVPYLTSVVLPMMILNIVTNLSCVESATVSGDLYNTKRVLLLDGLITIFGALIGNPFPTGVYIGHPAFKSMGATVGYNYINGVTVLLIGVLNGATIIKKYIPEVSAFGLLVWIGLCVTTDGFKVKDKHKIAVTFGLLPSIAAFLVEEITTVVSVYTEEESSLTFEDVVSKLEEKEFSFLGLISLSKGYLLSSIFLTSTMVKIIDRDFLKASMWMFLASFLSFVGIVHAFEVNENGTTSLLGFPARTKDPRQYPIQYCVGYLTVGVILLGFHWLEKKQSKSEAKESEIMDTERTALLS